MSSQFQKERQAIRVLTDLSEQDDHFQPWHYNPVKSRQKSTLKTLQLRYKSIAQRDTKQSKQQCNTPINKVHLNAFFVGNNNKRQNRYRLKSQSSSVSMRIVKLKQLRQNKQNCPLEQESRKKVLQDKLQSYRQSIYKVLKLQPARDAFLTLNF